jgi:ABC-type branched-subunit amino acid transport system permease subunit
MGVSVYRYKVYAFVISASFAGLAGCLTRIPSNTFRRTPTTSS